MPKKKMSDALADLGNKSVGSVIWWHVEGNHLRTDIDTLAKQHGIKELRKRARGSFTASLNAINKGDKGIICRKIRDDFSVLVYVMADVKSKAGMNEMELGDQSWVALDKFGGHITWREKDPRTEAFATQFRWFEEHYTHGDVRAMVEREIFNTGAISLRSTGGVYFIPEQKLARVEEVNDFLTELGNDSHVSMVSIRDEAGQRSIQRDFEQGAKGTLDNMLTILDETLDGAKRNKMIKELAKVRADAESMKLLISFKSSKLDKKLKEVEKAIKSALVLEA